MCGYGLIKTANNQNLTIDTQNFKNPETFQVNKPDCSYIASGRITLPPKSPMYLRLKTLYDSIIDIIRKYNPHEMVVERIFFAKSVKAALNLGHSRGIALLAAASEGLNVYEYSALEVKKAVTGYGRAEKRQVQDMVIRILNLKSQIPHLTEDSADALAIALCHLNNVRFKEALSDSSD
ncbi:MAG: crossover junction endodeoxyribonuclease RuvC [Nitrospirae bacterium RBG_13_39_12]|nr:MAG: crossover junction endodeoxyribonuclease RuvC [Nitrospirae bacterium RBG_13_39_12]